MQFYCVTHKPVLFDPGVRFQYLSAVDLPGSDTIHIPDDYFGADYHGETLSEYPRLFALADLLAGADPTEFIYLFQYRKFVALKPTQQRSDNLKWAFYSPPEMVPGLFPHAADLKSLNGSTLIGPFHKVGTLAGNYAQCHVADDFACFMLALACAESFDLERCRRFARYPVMIPAPGLGLFRIGDFLNHMRILRSAWSVFNRLFYVPRPGYQRRAGSFLIERVHSFLLCEEIAKGGQIISGHQIVVGDSPTLPTTL
jgi:hypothetical protein